ncbi:MAG: 50S ribosomal protein L11, partial [Candidatus Bathyarchaeia archaeon]
VETKGFEVSVGVPTTAALIVKEMGIEKGSGDPRSEKVGDLSMVQVVSIAKLKREELLSNTLEGAMKEVMGTCLSMGITVDGRDPRDAQRGVDQGEYDELFKE